MEERVMAGNQGNNRVVWKPWQLRYLKANWKDMTARQLSDHLGIKRTKVREKKYALGLFVMELEYWTREQVHFLKSNYRKMGDVELAEIFNRKWKKRKGWTHQHMEKKRRYLNLKRTEKELHRIKQKNIRDGRFALCSVKMWITRGGAAKEGTIRVWKHNNGRLFQVIKKNGTWVHLIPEAYRKIHGRIPNGKVVRAMDGDPFNLSAENLKAITRAQNASLNSQNRMPKELRESINLIDQLKSKITKHEKQAV
ncbi:MAG: HNH endonuclease [Bacteroidota bacterium]